MTGGEFFGWIIYFALIDTAVGMGDAEFD